MAVTERSHNPLTKLTPEYEGGGSRYFHPHGYIIERERRGWSERTGRVNGQADHPGPMTWWNVYKHVARRRSILEGKRPEFLGVRSESDPYAASECATLREARAWCDTHPRDGWQVDVTLPTPLADNA